LSADSVLKDLYREYYSEIKKRYLQADYTEGTFRTPLENFLKKLNPKYDFNQEPDRATQLGAPDFKVFRNGVKIGYIETKELGKNLDQELMSSQITKYKAGSNNIILTNYTRFVLIRNNDVIFDMDLFTISDLSNPTFPNIEKKIAQFTKMNESFVSYNIPTIGTGVELAIVLSKKAKILRDLAEQQLQNDINNSEAPSSLFDFYEGIQELINDISIQNCADAYAQTITYGLFLAKMNSKENLSRQSASNLVPSSVGIIKKIFTGVAADLPSNLTWIIDEIVEVLNASRMQDILSQIDTRGKKDRDPFTFFYEDFLKEYDSEKRKHLGVYYTPRPIISFIVNSVNIFLKKDFERKLGFADDNVTVLDPAVGTGTFLWLVYLLTLSELKNAGLSGLINSKISNHILKDFYGFEIQITPYIFAHLKLSSILKQWFYNLKDNDRAQVYLTNTLEPAESHGLIPFMRELNEESRMANEVKQRKKILAIVSNPPYSGESFNKGKWIRDLLKVGYESKDGIKDEGYFQINGIPLGEKNPKWINNDYVKFIRFAQWKIDIEGEGVVGFITDNSYLDNPTFRGVRWSLINSFNNIYILNLHGHSRKDRNPTEIGGRDENVFDIEQGVAISLFIKNGKLNKRSIFYADLWGTRDFKFHWLDRNTLNSIKWKNVVPKPPQYLFKPNESKLNEEYLASPNLCEIFPINSVGIVTARDHLTIKWSKDELWQTILTFLSLNPEDARTQFNLGKDARDWKVTLAQQDLKDSGPTQNNVVPIIYRPFDVRYSYYTGRSRGFQCMPRSEVMNHMKNENISLLFNRREALPGQYADFFVSDKMAEHKASSRYDTCYQAPLYLYKNGKRTSNVNPIFLERLTKLYNKTVTPEEIFYYVYAVGHSPTYRNRYDYLLRQDFPRILFTDNPKQFYALVVLGKELSELHLGNVNLQFRVKFDTPGLNIIKNIKYSNGKLVINNEQYFEGITPDLWRFRIGGYPVLEKWLKSRKGRKLEGSEIEQFLKIVEIIRETLRLMSEIERIPFLPRDSS
jgi:predicted helicase